MPRMLSPRRAMRANLNEILSPSATAVFNRIPVTDSAWYWCYVAPERKTKTNGCASRWSFLAAAQSNRTTTTNRSKALSAYDVIVCCTLNPFPAHL
jgi:hypothetical protein